MSNNQNQKPVYYTYVPFNVVFDTELKGIFKYENPIFETLEEVKDNLPPLHVIVGVDSDKLPLNIGNILSIELFESYDINEESYKKYLEWFFYTNLFEQRKKEGSTGTKEFSDSFTNNIRLYTVLEQFTNLKDIVKNKIDLEEVKLDESKRLLLYIIYGVNALKEEHYKIFTDNLLMHFDNEGLTLVYPFSEELD